MHCCCLARRLLQWPVTRSKDLVSTGVKLFGQKYLVGPSGATIPLRLDHQVKLKFRTIAAQVLVLSHTHTHEAAVGPGVRSLKSAGHDNENIATKRQ
uniref:Putative secreted protein n=1 Tax=Anopheles darlingi TaxID=43151 RepID=A0A2M4DC46_ANODA